MVADRYRDGHIDPDHAGVGISLEAASRATVASENRSAVPPSVALDEVDTLLVAIDANDAQDWPENLVLVDGHVWGDVVEEGDAGKEPVAFEGGGAAVNNQGCARGCSLVDIVVGAIERLAGDHRTHLRRRIGAVSNDQLVGAHFDGFNQRICDIADGHHHRDRHTSFSGRTVGRAHGGVGGKVEICVGQDHHVVLRTTQRLDPLAVRRRGVIDVLGDRARPDKAHGFDIGMFDEPIDGHLVAVHDVENPRWEPGCVGEFGKKHRCRRIALTGLEHEAVAGRQRIWNHPQRHHHGEVEGRDTRHHTKRLTQRVDIDTGRRRLVVVTLEGFGDPTCVLDVFEAPGHLAHCIAGDFAMLGGYEASDLLLVRLNEVTEGIHELCSASNADIAPARKRRLG